MFKENLMSANITNMPAQKISVKVVGLNGQISLGKEFAGRQVLIEEQEPGVWLIRTARVIPDNELWLHQPQSSRDLKQALHWANQYSPTESDPGKTIKKLENAHKSK
jgi:hypothetical protein